MAPIYECPHSPCSPPTLSHIWHWLASGQGRDLPLVWLQHPGSTLTTMVEIPSYRTSTAWGPVALLQEQERKRGSEGAREGVSSTSLLCWDHTSLARKRSQLLSNHLGGLLIHATAPQSLLNIQCQRRGTVEIQCWSGSYVTTLQCSLVQFPCSASLIGTVRLPQLFFFKPRWCFMCATCNLFDLQYLCLFGSFPFREQFQQSLNNSQQLQSAAINWWR